MKTDFETLRSLARYTIDHLIEKRYIHFSPENREPLIDGLATEYGVSFSTDEDIKEQAIEEVEDKLGEGNIPENITETEMFNHARKEIIKSFQGETIAGLYLVESLHQVAHRVSSFLMQSPHIEDVFASDEELLILLVQKIKGFSIK
ncbi:MAG: DUF507 family protein [Oligoflexia bacterium]|nr:DUF507 family protein [Oligoflexia bacterium]MBF0366681.1 DUF507 family protein [Oligoflexia bacterium]